MTDSVTPRAPDPPLVDPETGETPPLSPRGFSNTLADAAPFIPSAASIREMIERVERDLDAPCRRPPLRIVPMSEWEDYEFHLAEHLGSDDAA